MPYDVTRPEAADVDSNGNQMVSQGTRIAGERNEDSTTGADHTAGGPETAATTVDTSTNSTTITSAPALVYGIYVNTVLSAHTVVIKDDTTARITLPASLAAGTMIQIPGAIFETSLVVDPDDSSTGNITVFWRPLDTGVTWAY